MLMDYVLLSRCVRRPLLGVNVIRGVAGGVSDHCLVEGRLKVQELLGRIWRNRRVKEVVKLNELANEECKAEYERMMEVEWVRMWWNEVESVEEEWSYFKESIWKNEE